MWDNGCPYALGAYLCRFDSCHGDFRKDSMKVCNKCQKEKENDQFHSSKRTTDGLFVYCKQCRKEYDQKRHDKLRPQILVQKKKRKKELGEWLAAYKAKISCVKCGFSHPAAIDFHHRDANDKRITIGDIKSQGLSIKYLQEEIDKCDALCANCHRILHYNERKKTS